MNAVIVYDDVNFASKAQAMLGRAAHRADAALLWTVKPWRIELLILPPTAAMALQDAAEAHLIVLAVRRPLRSVAPAGGLAGGVGAMPAGPGRRARAVRRWQRRHALRDRGPRAVPIRRASWLELHLWRRGANRGGIHAFGPEDARTRRGADPDAGSQLGAVQTPTTTSPGASMSEMSARSSFRG